MRFDYYYGSQADQFSFIRIPRVMIKDPVFAVLSAYAKLLYSVLLDRMSLSSKNGWFDEENRVYIVYPVTEAQADLGIGKKKAMEVIAELVDFGLLEKKRRGQGLPSLLYVKSFMTGLDTVLQGEAASSQSEVPESESQEAEKTQKKQKDQPEVSEGKLQILEPEKSEVSNPALQDPREPAPHRLDEPIHAAETVQSAQESPKSGRSVQYGPFVSEVPKRTLQEVHESTLPEVSKPALLEVPKPAPLMSKTDNNYTYRSYPSNPINISQAGMTGQSDGMRSDGNAADDSLSGRVGGYFALARQRRTQSAAKAETIRAYRELIQENIRYGDLCAARRYDRERVDGIVDLILETVLGRNEQIRIAGDVYPVEIVRSKFLKLGYEHIDYVLDCMDANTTKVRNIKKYLLAALFNAPSTMNGYYRAEVNHDMPQYAKWAQ